MAAAQDETAADRPQDGDTTADQVAPESPPELPPAQAAPPRHASTPRQTRSQTKVTKSTPAAKAARKCTFRCAPCTERDTDCNRAWPSCTHCIRHGTSGQCYKAAETRINQHYALTAAGKRRLIGSPEPDPTPSPPSSPAQAPDPSSPDPSVPPPGPSSPTPSATRVPAVLTSTIRSESRPTTVGSRTPRSARGAAQAAHRGGNRVPAPVFDGGANDQLRAVGALAAAQAELLRAQAALDAMAAPALAPAVLPLPGLNVGVLHGAVQPRAPIAVGVIAEAEFSYVAQNIVDLFLRKNWTNHISFVYLTDAYNKQSTLHLATTTYKSHVDPITGETAYIAQPLPGLNEHSLSYADHSRAFQRFEAILRATNNPLAARWSMHGHWIRHHPLLTTKWPLLLAYDIAIRRRSITDHALDMGTFQTRIFDACRADYQEDRYRDLASAATTATNPISIRTTSAPSRAVESGRPRAQPPAARLPGPASKPALPARQAVVRCFACGVTGHMPKDCTNAPIMVTASPEGKWLLNAASTSAASAQSSATMPKHAGTADPRRVVTPLIPEAWEALINKAGIMDHFHDLPEGLRAGFRIGVSSSLSSITIHPNHKSATDQPIIILKHIAKEVEAGRYSGPFSPSDLLSLIGNFRASPLGVVDKPSSPGDFRIIQDFSYPRDHPSVLSVNSEIDVSDFPCSWGFFSDVVSQILDLPEGSQAATFDIDAAYRQMPVHPDDQAHIVVHWNGQCWVDHCLPFGGASSGGIFGRVGDCLLEICVSEGMGPVLKWVDDFLFFRIPIPGLAPYFFTYAESDVYALAVFLGIPWKIAKTMPFATLFRYIGFLWDIPTRRVSIPEDKRAKFAQKIRDWIASRLVTLKSTQSVLGSLIHCALAMPEGRSRVVGIAKLTSAFSHHYKDRFRTRVLSVRALEDATWWLEQFTNGDCGSTLAPPPALSAVRCYMDASTSFGVGIMIDNTYGMWRLRKGWKEAGRDIGWAEMIAIELTVEAMVLQGVRDATVTLHSDNQGVIGAIFAGRSRNDQQNLVLQRIIARSMERNLRLDMRYIATDLNPADAPSRGTPPPASLKMTTAPSLDVSASRWLIWV